MIHNAWTFLSRLCGGEDAFTTKKLAHSFLSRLCGGEAKPFFGVVLVLFLSRLCGGEGVGGCFGGCVLLSKPPMWR